MDLRELEMDVQRLVGYTTIVTSGVANKGPHLDFNFGRRLLRIWIPRTGVDPKRVAEHVRGYMTNPHEPAYKEMEYQPT